MQVAAKPVAKTLDCGKQNLKTAATAEMALSGSIYKLTERREITPYVWVHPNDDDRR